jgi:phage-related protein
VYGIQYTTDHGSPLTPPDWKLGFDFYVTPAGKKPVQSWLHELESADMEVIGYDVYRVQLGWPMDKPLVDKLGRDLWEVRSDLSGNRISRLLFTIHDQHMIALHGVIKKSRKLAQVDRDTAISRLTQFRKDNK